MRLAKRGLLLALFVMAGACVGRQIFYVQGCMDRLASGYKQAECRACVERPVPHEYLPDQPDGTRCVRR